MSFDLILIRRFEAVCRLRSFSRAADELGLSHSAMTKSIRTLEDGLKVCLLERTTRALALTEAGQRLLKHVPDLLAHAEDVKAAISTDATHLNVICGPVILDALGHRALLEFRTRSPEVHVAMQVMTPALAFDQLVRQRADLLLFHENVVRDIADRKALSVTRLISEPYVVLFRKGHSLARAGRSFESMLGFDWAIAGFDSLFQKALPTAQRAMLLRSGFPKYRIPSLSACADIAERSDLVTVAPASAAAALMAGRALLSAPLPGKARFTVCAVTRADAVGSAHVAAFIESVGRLRAPDSLVQSQIRPARKKKRR
ncbi:MAG: LysR family transcriptional regulator [Terricaulis sp.]